jgi:hypothetical protein
MTKSKNISITITIGVPREMFEEMKDVLGYFAFAHAAETANPFKPRARKKNKEKVATKAGKKPGRPKGKK